MADASRMTLGEIVDYCEAYNARQRQREKAERKQQKQGQKRKATAEDYRAWFGG